MLILLLHLMLLGHPSVEFEFEVNAWLEGNVIYIQQQDGLIRAYKIEKISDEPPPLVYGEDYVSEDRAPE